MNFPKPTRKGYMLDLWNRLQPNRSYSTEEIYSLAEGLPVDTVSNLIYTSINQQRGYLILDQSTDCYFRSDSNISMDSTQGLSVEESEIDEVAIARNIVAMREQLKCIEEERAAKMQQIEKLNQEVADLDQSIVAIKEQLQPLRHFFPASAA
jgi:hypothetical protein